MTADGAQKLKTGRCVRCGAKFIRVSKTIKRRFCGNNCRNKYHLGETVDFKRMEEKLTAKMTRMVARLKKDLRAEFLKFLVDRDSRNV
jgi:predicted  nucleic acid-binding Zn-ribbon protein